MTPLLALWLPILLSAVLVFIVSAVFHTVLPWHRNDFRTVPDEERFMDALRPLDVPPGDYMVPRASSMKDMRSPEFKSKMERGPVLMATVMPKGVQGIGKNLAQWFVYCLVVSVFAAYVASRALPPGSDYLAVFRFAGVTAFVGYALALWQATIWFRRSLVFTLKETIDGLIYGLLTAGVFGWLWPR